MSQKDDVHWVSDSYSRDSLHYSSLETVIKILNGALEAQKRGEWKALSLEAYEDYGTCRIVLSGSRPETDDEKKLRLQQEKDTEKYQRQQYEILKKKFEKDITYKEEKESFDRKDIK